MGSDWDEATSARGHPRVSVFGGPGTGKTVHAVLTSVQLADAARTRLVVPTASGQAAIARLGRRLGPDIAVESVEDVLAASDRSAHVVVDQAALVSLDCRDRIASDCLTYVEYLDPSLANAMGRPRSPFVKSDPVAKTHPVELRIARRLPGVIAGLSAGLVKRSGLRRGNYDDGVLLVVPGSGKYGTGLRSESTLVAVRRGIAVLNRDGFLQDARYSCCIRVASTQTSSSRFVRN